MDPQEVTAEVEVPPDTYRIRLGVKLTGKTAIELRSLQFSCEGGVTAHVDVVRATWQRDGWHPLYATHPGACGDATCLMIDRLPSETAFVAARDTLDLEVAEGVWMHMPLAVWTDGTRTFPAVETKPHKARFGMTDLEARLATITSAWGIAYLFYPYFKDQQIDWPAELPGTLADAAAASSAEQVHGALSRLLAKLHDDHARAVHPSRSINGILPVALRRFSNKLIVVGAVEDPAHAIR